MQIAAIVTFTGSARDFTRTSKVFARTPPVASGAGYIHFDLLGQNLIDRTLAKLKDLATLPPAVIAGGSASSPFLPSRSRGPVEFVNAWEEAVAGFAQNGASVLCLLRVSGYCDLDFGEILRFHLETNAPVTQAYAPDGPLDIAVVDASRLNCGGSYRKAISKLLTQQERFLYRGYVNRLRQPWDLYCLVEDGLYGRCGLRPVGREIEANVWQAESAQVDPGTRFIGPAFIGARSRIGPGCTISVASVERNCRIDCGSFVDQSCVLQDTYVGMALDVRRAIVYKRHLYNLDRNTELVIDDRRLLGATARPFPLLAGLKTFWERGLQTAD